MNSQIMLKLMSNLRELHQDERWTRAQLEAYQAGAFRRQRQYAYGAAEGGGLSAYFHFD